MPILLSGGAKEVSEAEVYLVRGRGSMVWPLTDGPVVLRFRVASFEGAAWQIAKYPDEIPALELEQFVVKDGLTEIIIEGPDGREYGRYLANRVKMNYPAPGSCCLFNEFPGTESPTAWSEWHVHIHEGDIVVEKQPPIVVQG
jgi:hypothetical protein